MPDQTAPANAPKNGRDETRTRILDTFIAMMSEGDAVLNHDTLAELRSAPEVGTEAGHDYRR